MSFALKLKALGFEPGRDFLAQDDSDGRGPYIKAWRSERPQPDQAAIDATVVPPYVPPLSEAERLIDALSAEGIIPAAKVAAIKARIPKT